jgi:protein-tyrosine phosphatase
VAIHCRAGIGRSTTLAACVLILLGVEGDVALDMIAAARGLEVPETEAQRQWVLGFSQAARPGSA